ncbi:MULTISPECIES: hypothetical protein [unclassified Microcoleus]|uniref:hypothetical protein n=1 Tax=unclassified Microcoleus TaxID=2642155 RepID=UPI002FD1B74C
MNPGWGKQRYVQLSILAKVWVELPIDLFNQRSLLMAPFFSWLSNYQKMYNSAIKIILDSSFLLPSKAIG